MDATDKDWTLTDPDLMWAEYEHDRGQRKAKRSRTERKVNEMRITIFILQYLKIPALE